MDAAAVSSVCVRLGSRVIAGLIGFAVVASPVALAASDRYGQVTFNGLPVPGATVVATQGEAQVLTATDEEGVYRLADLADGVWTIRIEMLGFAPLSREITMAADTSPSTWELALLPFGEIARAWALEGQATFDTTRADLGGASGEVRLHSDADAGVDGPPGARAETPRAPAGFQRTDVAASGDGPLAGGDARAFGDAELADLRLRAADGFLIDGSVNNSAVSPFALPRAFGNFRPGQRSLYTGMVGGLFGNSAWDARPFSFTGERAGQPSYHDAEFLGTFGGPVRLPGLRNRANVFVGYQRSAGTNAVTQSALMPTPLERAGDFSQSRDALGRPVQIVDPATGQPFPGNLIPSDRISPQAAALLGYYPVPNPDAGARVNYQAPILTDIRRDSVQARLMQPVNARTQVSGTVAYQRTTADATTLFGFQDGTDRSALDTQANWTRRISLAWSLRLGYQLTRQTARATPYFANRTNVSGEAGILGNDQDPANWGPPALTFASGVAGLADATPGFTRTQTHAWSAEGSWWSRGRHNLTFGGDVRRQRIDILSQQDPRGTFAFTGAATGLDLADFLLGLPQTSSLAVGNADKYFRASSYDAYVTDDWRIGPTLSLNVGVRWEYEAPIAERLGRLVNLDVAPGFAAVSPVVADAPAGALTGQRYPSSLVRPDKTGFQPRVALAWRPVPGSSLVVRAGYGLYRNTAVYQSIATLLAQQPPLSRTFSVERNEAQPLTLADGFASVPVDALGTFAVDPDFRVGYAHNWQASVQRDLPASLTIVATYLGTKGSRLMQQVLPNTYPVGAEDPCPGCPKGFVYLTSTGSSRRHAGQLQLRRRLRNGFTASLQYTLSTATDNAAAFAGASAGGGTIAQDWRDLDAEWGPSSFDQRHLVTAQAQYTTGQGIAGGTLVDGLKGRLLKDWTFTGELTAGSGLPLTPVYLAAVPGTGIVGTIRASLTGAPVEAVPEGFYLNPAAYAPPGPGEWGDAGRNAATGPAPFALNASIARTFRTGDRINLDWRIDVTNVLNAVTYASVTTLVGSPQFGLPNRTNDMRKVRTSVRVRF